MAGKRSVSIQGDVHQTLIITGDDNQVCLSHAPGIAFRLLDETFRTAQKNRIPADFYNGTRPNWANIALEQDARRNLMDALQAFVTDAALPPQRIGVITGLSGEGKTTLLMRLAWELSQAGFIVLWSHHGSVSAPYRCDFEQGGAVMLCVDDLVWWENLESLVSDLHESGLPFVLLGTACQNEWENSGLESALCRMAGLQRFHLGPPLCYLLVRCSIAKSLHYLFDNPDQRESYCQAHSYLQQYLKTT